MSFICRFWTFLFPTFCAPKSFICRLLDISISYILCTKVIYLSFLDICISYILCIKVIYLSFVGHLYFLHFVHQSHLSVVCWTFVFPTFCTPKSFICRLLDICISYILYTKVIYLSFVGHLYFLHFIHQSHLSVVCWTFVFPTFCTPKSFICRLLDICISYILYIKVIYLSFVGHLYFLHFVHQSHLSVVCWTFVFPTFCASKSFICRLLDICISYILCIKVIYLSFVGHLYFLHFIHQSHLSVVCWTFVFPTFCASKSFICRLLDICISYILCIKVIYLSFVGHLYFLHFIHQSHISVVFWTFVFPTFYTPKSFICRLLDICISYILCIKVIYLSFVGHLYFLHFVHQSHLSVVCWTFVFPTFYTSKSFICRLLDICISYILYTKVIYLSFVGHLYFLHFIHQSHLSVVCWTFVFPTCCASKSFICRLLDICISYILYTKVIYLSFFGHFYFLHFVHHSFICRF